MTIFQDIAGLIEKAMEVSLIETSDQFYVQNQVLNLLHLQTFPERIEHATKDTIPNLLERIIAYAIKNNLIEDVLDDKEILSANLMNCFVARPSVINEIFNSKYKESPKAATDYFYHLSVNSNYIQMNRIQKNIHYKVATEYGTLDITINLSKPEKDPEQIKRERSIKHKIAYPTCVLCMENEGYAGRTGYPARANHRIIQVPILDENWYFQYSPYVYYNEHSILLSEEHRDMKIDKQGFLRLLTFIEKFPHYFIGSNADLPIVGGSILSHDHYQAGRYTFAMEHAADDFTFELNRFPNVNGAVLKWPLSVLRLQSHQKQELVDAADYVLQTWKTYQDENAQIHAFTNDIPHNTITPIARIRSDNQYELDLVLRNNRTVKEHPLGIFHPHEEVHHIKKENIGLIEVMGLAVLPSRLKTELREMKNYLLGNTSNVESYHQEWAKEIKQTYGQISDGMEADDIIQKELGKKFVAALEHAGVFKQTEAGMKAFRRFIHALNHKRSG
ncbi:UDP-glucose--hexose-1-phosphate uridylyltransferase [Paucisalibacillus globulus]|uniref:UDP-glucose--hexose-1-phosphate uridylyltransferase n=1 Tax=Paucisalibacillus globulus TaxID=351095 RepID=UPI0003FE1D24|nr:UDP-glucose--hexose-1-phosphate uridylyltransferase [Paucisalibacillus globulus]